MDALEHRPPDRSRGFAPGFTVRLQDKDMRLALDLLRHLGLDAPGTELTASLFRKAVEQGLGESGDHAIYRLWEAALGN